MSLGLVKSKTPSLVRSICVTVSTRPIPQTTLHYSVFYTLALLQRLNNVGVGHFNTNHLPTFLFLHPRNTWRAHKQPSLDGSRVAYVSLVLAGASLWRSVQP